MRTQSFGNGAADSYTCRDIGLGLLICADTRLVCWAAGVCAKSAEETFLLSLFSAGHGKLIVLETTYGTHR
jgi:hypothetical protein